MEPLRIPIAPGERVLVVTGDDFGLTPGVNRGIVHAHRDGVLTHASLMASAPFVLDAVDRARQTPSLSVGVHLVLVDGRPCRHPEEVPTLVDDRWRFRPSAAAFLSDWGLGRIRLDDVETELRAQIERLLLAGLQPTHLDSHKHLHMWPPIFHLVLRLAREYRIPAVRLTLERPVGELLAETWHDRITRRQAVQNAAMVPLAWLNQQALRTAGIERAWLIGRVQTGALTLRSLERAFERLPPGRAELMTHPGFVDAELASTRTRLCEEREREVELLCSPEVKRALTSAGITLARRVAGRSLSDEAVSTTHTGPMPLGGHDHK